MLNKIYTVLKFIVGTCVSIALFRHLKQQKEMRDFARSVSLKIEKSGGAVVVNQDNSVSIIMDGKVQVVLPNQEP